MRTAAMRKQAEFSTEAEDRFGPAMTVEGAAKLLSVCKGTIYRLLNQGILKPYAFRVGSDWRFTHKSLEQFIEAQRGL